MGAGRIFGCQVHVMEGVTCRRAGDGRTFGMARGSEEISPKGSKRTQVWISMAPTQRRNGDVTVLGGVVPYRDSSYNNCVAMKKQALYFGFSFLFPPEKYCESISL
jgi:hypothetical protein